MNRGSLVRILLTMALVGDGVGLATALSCEFNGSMQHYP